MVRTMALILAAGASSRMGRPKALLHFNGESALSRVVGMYHALQADVLVITGCFAEKVRLEAHHLGVESRHNSEWHLGQTSSVKIGLKALPSRFSHVFIHPIDVPLVSRNTIELLRQDFYIHSSAGDEVAVVPSHRFRRGHPLLVSRSAARLITTFSPDMPLRTLFQIPAFQVHHVPVDDPWCLIDLDTPDDYVKALETLDTFARMADNRNLRRS